MTETPSEWEQPAEAAAQADGQDDDASWLRAPSRNHLDAPDAADHGRQSPQPISTPPTIHQPRHHASTSFLPPDDRLTSYDSFLFASLPDHKLSNYDRYEDATWSDQPDQPAADDALHGNVYLETWNEQATDSAFMDTMDAPDTGHTELPSEPGLLQEAYRSHRSESHDSKSVKSTKSVAHDTTSQRSTSPHAIKRKSSSKETLSHRGSTSKQSIDFDAQSQKSTKRDRISNKSFDRENLSQKSFDRTSVARKAAEDDNVTQKSTERDIVAERPAELDSVSRKSERADFWDEKFTEDYNEASPRVMDTNMQSLTVQDNPTLLSVAEDNSVLYTASVADADDRADFDYLTTSATTGGFLDDLAEGNNLTTSAMSGGLFEEMADDNNLTTNMVAESFLDDLAVENTFIIKTQGNEDATEEADQSRADEAQDKVDAERELIIEEDEAKETEASDIWGIEQDKDVERGDEAVGEGKQELADYFAGEQEEPTDFESSAVDEALHVLQDGDATLPQSATVDLLSDQQEQTPHQVPQLHTKHISRQGSTNSSNSSTHHGSMLAASETAAAITPLDQSDANLELKLAAIKQLHDIQQNAPAAVVPIEGTEAELTETNVSPAVPDEQKAEEVTKSPKQPSDATLEEAVEARKVAAKPLRLKSAQPARRAVTKDQPPAAAARSLQQATQMAAATPTKDTPGVDSSNQVADEQTATKPVELFRRVPFEAPVPKPRVQSARPATHVARLADQLSKKTDRTRMVTGAGIAPAAGADSQRKESAPNTPRAASSMAAAPSTHDAAGSTTPRDKDSQPPLKRPPSATPAASAPPARITSAKPRVSSAARTTHADVARNTAAATDGGKLKPPGTNRQKSSQPTERDAAKERTEAAAPSNAPAGDSSTAATDALKMKPLVFTVPPPAEPPAVALAAVSKAPTGAAARWGAATKTNTSTNDPLKHIKNSLKVHFRFDMSGASEADAQSKEKGAKKGAEAGRKGESLGEKEQNGATGTNGQLLRVPSDSGEVAEATRKKLKVPTDAAAEGDQEKPRLPKQESSMSLLSTSSRRSSQDSKAQNSKLNLKAGDFDPQHGDKQKQQYQMRAETYIREAIPFMPVWFAVTCLIVNIVFPGVGTMLSGFGALCHLSVSRHRYRKKKHQETGINMELLCVNFWVGVSQTMTISLLLVGWIWGICWGIFMIVHAVEWKNLIREERDQEIKAKALSLLTSGAGFRAAAGLV